MAVIIMVIVLNNECLKVKSIQDDVLVDSVNIKIHKMEVAYRELTSSC